MIVISKLGPYLDCGRVDATLAVLKRNGAGSLRAERGIPMT
jgi:hypothetical protein